MPFLGQKCNDKVTTCLWSTFVLRQWVKCEKNSYHRYQENKKTVKFHPTASPEPVNRAPCRTTNKPTNVITELLIKLNRNIW